MLPSIAFWLMLNPTKKKVFFEVFHTKLKSYYFDCSAEVKEALNSKDSRAIEEMLKEVLSDTKRWRSFLNCDILADQAAEEIKTFCIKNQIEINDKMANLLPNYYVVVAKLPALLDALEEFFTHFKVPNNLTFVGLMKEFSEKHRDILSGGFLKELSMARVSKN